MLSVPGGGAGPGQQRPEPRSTPAPPALTEGRHRAPQRAPGDTHLPGLGVRIPPSLPASVLFSPRAVGLTAGGLCGAFKGQGGCPPLGERAGPLRRGASRRLVVPVGPPSRPMFNNTLFREGGAGPCWGCGCPGMAGWGPFTDGGAEAQGRPAQAGLGSKQVQTLQQIPVHSGFPAGKEGCGRGRGLPPAILSLCREHPREGLGA